MDPTSIATARFAVGDDVTVDRVREFARQEAEGRGRREVIAVWNRLAAEVSA